jgi:hypothetical protein
VIDLPGTQSMPSALNPDVRFVPTLVTPPKVPLPVSCTLSGILL